MCFFPQFLPVLAVPRPVREGTGLCVSWGLPKGWWQPDASPGEPCDRSGYLNPGAARGKGPNSYCQSWAKQGLLWAGSKRSKSQKVQMNWGQEMDGLCSDPDSHTKGKTALYTPPTHTHTPLTVFEREFSGSITPQGLSQLDLSLLECVCISSSGLSSSYCWLHTIPHFLHRKSGFYGSNKLIFKTTLSCQVDLYFYPYQDLKTK